MVRSMLRAVRSAEEKVGRDEATLNRIDDQPELFKNGEAQEDSITGLTEDDATWDRLPIHSHRGLAAVSLSPASIREHKRDLAGFPDAELLENSSRDHGKSRARVGESRDLLGPGASLRINHNDLDLHLTHAVNAHDS